MTFSVSDWVLFSPGGLYGAPFVSGYLLYRLNDINCSLLLYVENGAVSATETDAKAGVILAQCIPREPEFAFLYASPSATTPLSQFEQLHPIKIPLVETAQRQRCLDRVTVSITR